MSSGDTYDFDNAFPPPILASCPINVKETPSPIYRLSLNTNVPRCSKITCPIFANFIVPEINRLWAPAGIQFYLKRCVEYIPENKPHWSHNAYGQSESALDRRFLTDPNSDINLFIVTVATYDNHRPTLGYACGNDDGAKYIVVGEKHLDRNTIYPLKRFSNTLAHEIGHFLGLDHNTRRNFLMYANPESLEDPLPGREEKLSSMEISTARTTAMSNIPRWQFGPFLNVERNEEGKRRDSIDLT